MSKAWAKGSTPAWRRTRAGVLSRDGYRCQLKVEGVCVTLADCVHHTAGRAVTGDDPRYLVAACTPCNSATGDPSTADPPPSRRTKW